MQTVYYQGNAATMSALSSVWLWFLWILREMAKVIYRPQGLTGLDELNYDLVLN